MDGVTPSSVKIILNRTSCGDVISAPHHHRARDIGVGVVLYLMSIECTRVVDVYTDHLY